MVQIWDWPGTFWWLEWHKAMRHELKGKVGKVVLDDFDREIVKFEDKLSAERVAEGQTS